MPDMPGIALCQSAGRSEKDTEKLVYFFPMAYFND